MRAPLFWQQDSWISKALSPLARVYGTAHLVCSHFTKPQSAEVPVICVGNLVAGGAGKTPVVIALAELFKAAGKKVFLLTRGYGGNRIGPIIVDEKDVVEEVGDEALLLARHAPTVMSKDRPFGAKAAFNSGAEIIVMDDGYQNNKLKKDFSILVIDGHYGFGNGLVMPAGPLRETLEYGLVRAGGFIIIGEDKHNLVPMLAAKNPVLRAHMETDASAANLKGKRVVAFAGIGTPEKFFRSLREFGCEVKNTNGFPDHYVFKLSDIEKLRQQAKDRQAQLVTTEKDFVRIPPEWREGITPIPAKLVFEDVAAVKQLLAAYL